MKPYQRSQQWAQRTAGFIERQYEPLPGGYPSVPGGVVTLYGTIYGLLMRRYLGGEVPVPAEVRRFFIGCQDSETGYFIGPEMREWTAPPGAKHDREHLLLHLTCAALPVMQEFGIGVCHPLRFAHRFCDSSYLAEWLEQRDMSDAWLEGNNLLFVGQILVHLRDVEAHPGAGRALRQWFRWLDNSVDSAGVRAYKGLVHPGMDGHIEKHRSSAPGIEFFKVDIACTELELGGDFHVGLDYRATTDFDDMEIDVGLRVAGEAGWHYQATNRTFGRRVDLPAGEGWLDITVHDLRVVHADGQFAVAIWRAERAELLFWWRIPVRFASALRCSGTSLYRSSFQVEAEPTVPDHDAWSGTSGHTPA